MDRTQADAYISQLGNSLGLDGLALDADGLCMLVLDGGVLIITLGYQPGTGSFNLMICLDEVVPTPAQMSELLSANFGWARTDGGAFALEPSTGALALQRRCGDNELQSGLYAIIEGMVNVAERWRDRLLAAESQTPETHGDAPLFPLGGRV